MSNNAPHIGKIIPLNLPVKMGWRLDLFIALLIIFIFAFFMGSSQEPFENVHWDAPIYLYHSKRFVETPLLKSYMSQSNKIAVQVKEGGGEDEKYSGSYWRFMRLGHIALLGSISCWGKTDMQSIYRSILIYRFLLAMSLVFSVLMSLNFIELINKDINKKYLIYAAVISSLLYASSNVWAYLSGNLVSEIPALFFLSVTTWLVVQSVRFQSYGFAILSGIFAFLLYFVRIESVWYYLTFIVSFLLGLVAVDKRKIWWPAIFVSGAVALFLYCSYAYLFYPLCDPRLIISFSKTMIASPDNFLWRLQIFFAAGGYLWIGFVLLIILGRLDRKFGLVLFWFALNISPWILLASFPREVRPVPMIYPSLLLISISGWALFLKKAGCSYQGKVKAVCLFVCVLFLVSISVPYTYRFWKTVPGGWRLGYVRNFIKIPPFQKKHYYIQELENISRVVYKSNYPLLIWTSNVEQEDLNIMRYFGPSYASNSNLALTPDPTAFSSCSGRSVDPEEPVFFCNESIDEYFESTSQNQKCVLLLDKTSKVNEKTIKDRKGMQELMRTEHFQLYAITCNSTFDQ